MICKFCHSEKILVRKKIKSSFNGNLYPLWECKLCRNNFFEVSSTPSDYREMYESFSEDREISSFKESPVWKIQKREIIKLLNHQPQSIMDIGCRTGDFLMHFDQKTLRAGIELSNKYVKIGQKRGLNIIQGNAENTTFNEKYEVVTCYAILEHLHDPLTFLNSIQGLVRKKGLLVIMIPSIQTLKARFIGDKWHMLSPPEHINFFSRQFLDDYLKNNGFNLIKRYYTSGGMLIFKNQNYFVRKIENIGTKFFDHSFCNKFPIFDHMYSYYLNEQN